MGDGRDVPDGTFACPDLTTFTRLDELGLDAVLAEGRRVLIDGPGRFDGVAVVGVDEHAWRHTRRGDKYVTVIIDLTAVRGVSTGGLPALLLRWARAAGRSREDQLSCCHAYLMR